MWWRQLQTRSVHARRRDEELAKRARSLANHGSSRKYFHDDFGTNSRLDALQADAVLAALAEAQVGTAKYYPLSLHEQIAMEGLTSFEKPSLSVAESRDG